jgi:hypothetical protein
MTVEKIARGATDLRTVVSTFLADATPALITKAREDWEVENWQLPFLTSFDTYEPNEVTNDQFPFCGAFVVRNPRTTRFSQDHQAQNKYRTSYQVRVLVWARSCLKPDDTWEEPEYNSAIRLRDDLVAIVRQALLSTPSMGTEGDDDVPHCVLNDETMIVDYFDLKLSKGNTRWAAGASINFTVDATEQIWQPRLDTSNDNTIVVTGATVATDSEL